jgi:tRNA A37 N6-isopentenylltransferase MiaA
MKTGTTNRIRQLQGQFTIAQAMQFTQAGYREVLPLLSRLKAIGEVKRVKQADIGRYAKRKSVWQIIKNKSA